jgi:serine/threonine-protein kinase
LIGTGVAVAGLAVGGWHYFNQLQLTAAIEAIADFKAKGQYDQCIRQAQNFPSANLQVQTLLGDCQIGQARQLAQQRKFKDAIVAVSGVAISLPARAEAEKLAIQWTQQILQLARDRYQQGKFTEAIALAQAVPKTSPIVEKVNNQVSQWQKEQQTYQPHLQAAQKALTEKKWQVAIAEAGKLPKTPPWQQQANLIIKQAQAEIDQAAVAAAQAAATAEPANVSPSGAYDTPLPAPEPTYDPPPAPTPAPPPVFAPPASSSGDGGNAPGGIPSDVIRNAPACGGGAC